MASGLEQIPGEVKPNCEQQQSRFLSSGEGVTSVHGLIRESKTI
jgi:hypothetical protein